MSYVGKITDTAGNTHLVGSTLYGTCTTAAATAAKVVTCSDFDKLETGVTIHVKFSNNNTASNATLNVNSTGAKPLCSTAGSRVATVESQSWSANSMLSLTYDGTSWVMNDYIPNSDTHYTNMQWVGTSNGALGVNEATTNPYLRQAERSAAGAVPSSGSNNQLKGGTNMSVASDANGVITFTPSTTTTINSSDGTGIPTNGAVYTFVTNAIDAAISSSLEYQGAISDVVTDYEAGWFWIADGPFTIPAGTTTGHTSTVVVEIGDMVIANSDATTMTADTVDVIQSNIETLSTTDIDNIWAAA